MSLNMVHTVAVLKASELLVALVKDAGGAGPGLAGPSCAYRVTCLSLIHISEPTRPP